MGGLTREDRFWSKVAIGEPDECWPWMAARDKLGRYGQFWNPQRCTMDLAHRVAYELAIGPLPVKEPGMFGSVGVLVCHSCDNPPCVNPGHLFLGDQVDNIRDMKQKGRAPNNSGDRNPRAKLTKVQVVEIRAALIGGYRNRSALARKYGLSTAQVSKIALGQTWPDENWVPMPAQAARKKSAS